VIDGLSGEIVGLAMVAGCGLLSTRRCAYHAGNYGGKLGPYHLHLRKLLKAYPE
jgi:formylmethanofuran:tetrahydromethanopterin formyltransferase